MVRFKLYSKLESKIIALDYFKNKFNNLHESINKQYADFEKGKIEINEFEAREYITYSERVMGLVDEFVQQDDLNTYVLHILKIYSLFEETRQTISYMAEEYSNIFTKMKFPKTSERSMALSSYTNKMNIILIGEKILDDLNNMPYDKMTKA